MYSFSLSKLDIRVCMGTNCRWGSFIQARNSSPESHCPVLSSRPFT